jgi:hypothetical protein
VPVSGEAGAVWTAMSSKGYFFPAGDGLRPDEVPEVGMTVTSQPDKLAGCPSC